MKRTFSFKIHFTWIFIFALITTIVATQFSENYLLWQRIILGIVVSLLFLFSVAIREFTFGLTAFHREIPIKKINLFAFGGVYQENKDSIITTHVSLFYLARYLSNLIIAAIFYALYATFVNTDNLMLAGIAQWLTYIYVLLFLLHFIPAFPLDGGHILRTILWKTTGDYYKATHIASLIGMAVGFFLIFAGVLIFIVTQQWIISLLMVVIGWIIEIAAGYTRRRVKANIALRNTRAEDIMTREYPVMPQQMSIGQLIREQILIKGCRYIIVADDGKMKGILTMDQIRSIPGRRWNKTTIGDVMIPANQIKAANLQQAADTLLDEMRLQSIDYIPVMKDSDIAGVVTRQALMDLVKIRTGFGV